MAVGGSDTGSVYDLDNASSRTYPAYPAGGRPREDADLVERCAQFGRVAVYAERARAGELIFAIAAAQETDAERARATGREQVPDGVADDVAIDRGNAEPLGAGQKEIATPLLCQWRTTGSLARPFAPVGSQAAETRRHV
jgi:hypothetical protein